MCQCAACGLFFGSDRCFDRHRHGRHEPYERRCLSTAELQAAGLVEHNGVWKEPNRGAVKWARAEETTGGLENQ